MKHLFSFFCTAVLCTSVAFAQSDSTEKTQQQDLDVIPVVSANSDDLSESISDQNVASMLASSGDIYAATLAYRLNQAGFRYRGYRNDQFTTIINGILINDPENGQSFFNGSGAFTDLMRNRSGSLGLLPSSFAFGGLGGSYNLDLRAGGMRKGLSLNYTATNRSYYNRLNGSYSTGYIKGGWAFTVAFSRRWAVKGYEPGTSYDGYGYFLGIEKKFGTKNRLALTIFGTPTQSARATSSVREFQQLAGTNYYNADWGYQNGQIRSANVNKRFEPTFMLTHEAKISNKTNIITGIDFEIGRNQTSNIDYFNSPSPDPDYYKNLPSLISDPGQRAMAEELFRTDANVRQIAWDKLYAINRAAPIGPNGRQSSYILGDRMEDNKQVNFNTTLNHTFYDHISLTAGLTYQWEKVRHYKQVNDLLGGDYYVNLNDYAVQDFPTNPDVLQNDLQHPNRILHVGDAYEYDYSSQIHKTSVWLQPYFKFNHVEFFVSGQLTHNYYWRTGNVQNGLYPDNSLGDSKKISLINYAIKAGFQYKINGRNYFYANGEVKTEAPTFNQSFLSARIRNEVVTGLTNENVYAAEIGYQYKSPIITLKISGFYTEFQNGIQNRTFFHDDYRTNVNYSLTGIGKRELGGELGFDAKIYKGFSVNLVASGGLYKYSSNASATITKDNSDQILANQTAYIKNYYLGGMPQVSGSLGFKYSSKHYWYVGINFNYFDQMYVEINPIRRTLAAVDLVDYGSAQYNEILHQEKLKGQFTMDMTGGYNLLLNKYIHHMGKYKYSLNFYGTLTNMANNRNFVINGQEQLRYDYGQNNLDKFGTKYRYMHGFGYFVSVAFRMQ
ncbi:MAG: TonB-dependent receptor [Bacteroidetes bacterium]|nr:TonB-dependent receptor [Bacteroidota bacterium]